MALAFMSFGMVTLITQDGESLLFNGPNLRNRGDISDLAWHSLVAQTNLSQLAQK